MSTNKKLESVSIYQCETCENIIGHFIASDELENEDMAEICPICHSDKINYIIDSETKIEIPLHRFK